MQSAPPPADPHRLELLYQSFFREPALPYLDGLRAKAFLDDLAADAPAMREMLLGRMLPALAGPLPLTQKKRMLEQVANAALSAGHAAPFQHHDQRVLAGPLAGFIDLVNRDTAHSVVFVTSNPYFLLMREAMYLRRHGWRVFLVCLSPLPETLRPVFEAEFDGIACTQLSLRLMRALLAALRPSILHVQCWMWLYAMGRMAVEARGTAKVVCEFYDVTSVYAERAVMCQSFHRDKVDLDWALERFLLHHADAVITRFPRFVIDEWRDRHGAMPPHLEMQAWPCAEFIGRPHADKPSRRDGRYRLVYAGALVVVDDAHKPIVLPEAGMARGFRILLEQGIAIDVLHGPFRQDGDQEAMAEYLALEHEFPHFHMLPGVPPDRLAEALAAYDFGILLFDWHPAARIRDSQRRGVMATKLYSYVEAGLPVLVNAEYEAMANFAEGNGVGLAIQSRDLPRLRDRLDAFDYLAAVANIQRFQDEQSMERNIHHLIALYDGLLANKS